MGRESVNKWSCLHFSPAISEATKQIVVLPPGMASGPQCLLNPSAAVRVPDFCVIRPVPPRQLSSRSLARKLAVCIGETLLVSVLPDFSVTSQTPSLLVLVSSRSLPHLGVEQKQWF